MNQDENKRIDTAEAEEITEAVEAAEAAEQPVKEKKAKKEKKEKKPPLFKNRKFRMGSTATVFTVVFVAAVLLLNVIAGILNDRYPLNLDLTGDGLYTMSEESKQVAANIKQPIEIVIFGTEDTYKAGDNIIYKQLYEFVRQYESLTKGLVSVQFVDATQDPQTYAKYSSYEVEDGDILFLGTDAENKENVRTSIASTEDLFEYDQMSYYYYGQFSLTDSMVEKTLASNLQAVSRETETSVVLLTGHGESEYTLSGVQEVLRQNGYSDCIQLDFTTAAEIDEKVSVAVICAPTEDYTADELVRLAEWVNNDETLGHHLVVFTDATASCPNLYEYLAEEHGVQVENYILGESDASNMFALNGQYNPYAIYSSVESTDHTAELATAEERIQLYLARGLTALWSTDPDYSFSYDTVLSKVSAETAVAVALDEENTVSELKADTATAILSSNSFYDNEQDHTTYTLVIGSADFFSLGYDNNETLFMNVFNGINDNADTISVDSVSLTPEALEYTAGTANVLGLGVFTIGLPLIMIVLGVVVFIRRKNL